MNAISTCTLAAGPTHCVVSHGNEPAAANEAVAVALPAPPTGRPLHRLGEVRLREGVSRRAVAQHLGISVPEVQEREAPSSDMLLSELYHWQQVLGVPVAELLSEPDDPLSPPVQLRSRLVRAMKTVRSIQEETRQTCIRRLAQTLVDQLVEIMPELAGVGTWPAGTGQRRTQSELGQAFLRGLSASFFDELDRLE
jgi:transcriptional regulator with XRE-family HTH domain